MIEKTADGKEHTDFFGDEKSMMLTSGEGTSETLGGRERDSCLAPGGGQLRVMIFAFQSHPCSIY